MRGGDIPKTRCAREEGRTKMTSTIREELYRIGMLFTTLSGRTTRDRGKIFPLSIYTMIVTIR